MALIYNKVAKIVRLERAKIADNALDAAAYDKGISIKVRINKFAYADLAPSLFEILISLIYEFLSVSQEQNTLPYTLGIQDTNRRFS